MKKGFTLIELLSVIVIISIITLIVFPIISSYLKDSKDKLEKIQIEGIVFATEKWSNENLDKLDKYHVNDIYISLKRLKFEKFLENEEIINPKTKIEMNGCVLIKYDVASKKYKFEYIETDDQKPDNKTVCQYIASKKASTAFIIYDLSETNTLEVDNTNKKKSAALDIISKNKNRDFLNVYGEKNLSTGAYTSGLFETDTDYVFAGADPVNNYVTYASKTWRVLSIDKNDLSMKLIATTSSGSQIWNTNFLYENSSIKLNINNGITYPKLKETWENGLVSDINKSVDIVRTDLSTTNISSKVGLLSVFDYTAASNSLTCNDNFKSTDCNNYNYLNTMFGSNNVWTMNNNGLKIWYRKNTGLLLGSVGDMAHVYPVIKVDSSTYINNINTATGSSPTFAYELK